MARCISASIMLSHGLRKDADVVFLTNKVAIHFVTSHLKSVRPDEGSLLGILRKVFRVINEGRGVAHSGVIISKRNLESYLLNFPVKYFCAPYGKELLENPPRTPVAFIMPFIHRGQAFKTTANVVYLKCPVDRQWPDQIIPVLNILLDRLSYADN
ncbi:MAG: hypothetical protein QXY49_03855 [Thermofilaceae archaeon]